MPLKTDEYVDQCNSYADQYIELVDVGYIITGMYIKKLVKKHQRLLNDERYVFRQDRVNKIYAFFSLLNIEHKNKFEQISLLPWQCFFIKHVFGFYYKSNPEKRLIREALLFIGRKNGKTALAAALQLYGLLADGVLNAQSMLLANTAGQASIALNFAKAIVTHSPLLQKRLVPQRSRIVFRDPTKQGFCQVFSSMEPARLEGTSPSMCLLDEVFNYDDNTIYSAIKTGIGARVNPLILLISTAGSKLDGFLNEYVKRSKDILDGKIEDDTQAAFIFQPDPQDDLSDTDNWGKANPSLSYINSLDDLKNTFIQAKYSIKDRYVFYTKHLNIFVESPDVWIPEEYLLPLFEDFDESELFGRDAYIGMDLSKNTDLSSIVLFVPGEKEFYAIPYFWMANMEGNAIRKSGKDLSNYIFDGHITKCDTKTIDLDLIYDKIIELSTKFNIVSIQYDSFNSPVLVSRLKEYGLNCEIFKQSASRFNAPLKMFEEMVYKRQIKMKNPTLLWNIGNIVLYIDGNSNIKIIKNKQNDSVDGAVALGMAIGGWVIQQFGEETLGLQQYIDAYKSQPS